MFAGLPETIRVKLSSEEAGAISLTQVVVRDIPVRELIEHMLGYTGKDEARLRDLLRRGSLVSGASRFRWEGWDPGPEGLRGLLQTFPDADPQRPFSRELCTRAVLRGGRALVELPREAGTRKPLFRRATFWDVLMELAGEALYVDYSYRERADWYRLALGRTALEKLRGAADLVAFSTLRGQLRTAAFETADLFVGRPEG